MNNKTLFVMRGKPSKLLLDWADFFGAGKYEVISLTDTAPPPSGNYNWVCLGANVMSYFGITEEMAKVNGCWINSKVGPVMVTDSPFYIEARPDSFPSWALALERSFRDPVLLHTPVVPYTLLTGKIPHWDEVCVDIESTGLERDATITCVSITAKNKTYIVPDAYTDSFRSWWEWTCENAHIIGHNLKFDLERLHLLTGVPVPTNIFDTMLAFYAYEPKGLVKYPEKEDVKGKLGKAGFALKPILKRIFSVEYGFHGDWAIPNRELLYPYAACDTYFTYALRNWLVGRLPKSSLRVLNDIQFPLNERLCALELGGIRIDMEAAKKNKETFNAKVAVDEAALRQILYDDFGALDFGKGPPSTEDQFWGTKPKRTKKPYVAVPYNPNSSAHNKRVFYDLYGFPAQYGKKSTVTTDAEAVKTLQLMYPDSKFLQALTEYRPTKKLVGTYVEGPLRRQKFSMVHAQFHPITETGRLTCKDPNIQNLPRGNTDEAKLIKRQYIGDVGHLVLECDWSQLELRILAWAANELGMIAAYKNNEDLHTNTAIAVFGDLYHNATSKRKKELRTLAKAVNFGIPYGASPSTVASSVWRPMPVAERLTTSFSAVVAQAKETYDLWLKGRPAVPVYWDKLLTTCWRQGYVETVWGRRKYVPFKPDEHSSTYHHLHNQIINFEIQSTASDLNHLAVIRTKDISDKYNARPIVTVHDSIVWTIPDDPTRIADFAREIKELMLSLPRQYISETMPFGVDFKLGKSWGDAEDYHVG